MKLTNQQHIDILDAFILENTEYDISDFTGGSISTTLTHNNTQIHYKINLYFGYKNKKPITKTISISEEIYSIMYKAITLKVKSMLKEESVFGIGEVEKLLKSSSTPTAKDTSTPTSRPTPTNTITYYLSTIDTNTIDEEVFKKWLEYKKYKNQQGVTLSANFLSGYDKETQKQIVETSIMNEWRGLFEPKNKKFNSQTEFPTSTIYFKG